MIYIDASRYNNTGKRTGVENYSKYLIDAMVREHANEITLISPRSIELSVSQIVIPFPRLWTQLRLSWYLLWNRSVRTLFVPSHVIPFISAPNTITTIHDVAFKRFPDSYSRASRWYLDWGVKRAVKKTKAIIVPSQATKDDLIHFYKAYASKIQVIPLGFASILDEGANDHSRLLIHGQYKIKPQEYFLFIGRIETKKNIGVLLKAFKQFSPSHPTIKLVLAGKLGRGGEILRSEWDHPNIVYLDYVSDDEKQALLKNALAFVFPSLYEGFGLPLLEAMDANLPIIASDIPSTHEIMDHHALYFDPNDPDALATCMKRLFESPDLKQSLVADYAERLGHYSWEGTAQKTWALIAGFRSDR